MPDLSTIAAAIGLGSVVTDITGVDPSQFDVQQAQFIKMQFLYGLQLKNRLAAGEIDQAYYDANFWLTTQTLDSPYDGWFDEFKTAIENVDLNWLSQTVGESVEKLTAYMGNALSTVIGSAAQGYLSGFFGGLNIWGWVVVIGTGVVTIYAWRKGYIQKALGLSAKAGAALL